MCDMKCYTLIFFSLKKISPTLYSFCNNVCSLVFHADKYKNLYLIMKRTYHHIFLLRLENRIFCSFHLSKHLQVKSWKKKGVTKNGGKCKKQTGGGFAAVELTSISGKVWMGAGTWGMLPLLWSLSQPGSHQHKDKKESVALPANNAIFSLYPFHHHHLPHHSVSSAANKNSEWLINKARKYSEKVTRLTWALACKNPKKREKIDSPLLCKHNHDTHGTKKVDWKIYNKKPENDNKVDGILFCFLFCFIFFPCAPR